MSSTNSYWLSNPNAPYATFLSIIQRYLHPEVEDLEALQQVAQRFDLPEIATFKAQFREVIANPGLLPDGALAAAAAFEDGTPEAFLKRLWHELYGDEKPNSSD
jgi:hypothetical protein